MKKFLAGKTRAVFLFVVGSCRRQRDELTGVRNSTARNNLRKMQKGDEVLFITAATKRP